MNHKNCPMSMEAWLTGTIGMSLTLSEPSSPHLQNRDGTTCLVYLPGGVKIKGAQIDSVCQREHSIAITQILLSFFFFKLQEKVYSFPPVLEIKSTQRQTGTIFQQ